jgi:2-succinyl-5-enolpyruvyl-6-hydroxy-3-cyclohexene-1-carboxylate synthase
MNTATFLNALFELGVKRYVICPGSRSAPLLLGLETLSGIEVRVIGDERSAAFHGLGWSESVNAPVALICTSGSAGLNFAPAVAEAFYRNIQLLIISADRPPEKVGQEEGQSLPQPNMYGRLVQGSWELNGSDDLEKVQIVVNSISSAISMGPLHINYSFEEPLYGKPAKAEKLKLVRPEYRSGACSIPDELMQSDRLLLLAGQLPPGKISAEMKKQLDDAGIPVIGDIASNIPGALRAISPFAHLLPSSFIPEYIVCLGGTHIWRKWPEFVQNSPKIKIYELREDRREIQRFAPLESIQIKSEINTFLQKLVKRKRPAEFYKRWESTENISSESGAKFHAQSDLFLMDNLLNQIDTITAIHIGNSLSIRYLDILLAQDRTNPVYSNRGVSGIDGCLSTAVGFAVSRPDIQNLLILGDQSLAYDSNGLWTHEIPGNLKIVVINNGGGQIFGMVKGPSESRNFSNWFLNESVHSFKWFSDRYSIPYFTNEDVDRFMAFSGCALLELKSDGQVSREELNRLINARKNYIQNMFQVRNT